jgi:hypothetical protein
MKKYMLVSIAWCALILSSVKASDELMHSLLPGVLGGGAGALLTYSLANVEGQPTLRGLGALVGGATGAATMSFLASHLPDEGRNILVAGLAGAVGVGTIQAIRGEQNIEMEFPPPVGSIQFKRVLNTKMLRYGALHGVIWYSFLKIFWDARQLGK